jgi:hypothetical protein
MNSAAALLPRLFVNNRRVSRVASTSLEPIEPARRSRGAVDAHADAVLTRTIVAGTLHTRWA